MWNPQTSRVRPHLEQLNICFSLKRQELTCNKRTVASKIQFYKEIINHNFLYQLSERPLQALIGPASQYLQRTFRARPRIVLLWLSNYGMHYCFYIRSNYYGWFFLIFSEFSACFQLFIFIALVKFALCSEESTPVLPQINYTLLDFYKIPLLAFIFIILDFKDVLLFYLLQSNSHWRNFLKGGFLTGQCSLSGFSLERKFRGNLPGDIFQE